jgi:hypothetical protein
MSSEGRNKPTNTNQLVEIKIPIYLVRQLEMFIQTPVAKDLRLTSIESVILHILSDWGDRFRELQNMDGKQIA